MIPAEFKRNFQNADMFLVEPKGMDSLHNFQCAKQILSHHSPVTGSTPLSVTLSIAMSSVISRKKTLERERGRDHVEVCYDTCDPLKSTGVKKKLLGKGIKCQRHRLLKASFKNNERKTIRLEKLLLKNPLKREKESVMCLQKKCLQKSQHVKRKPYQPIIPLYEDFI